MFWVQVGDGWVESSGDGVLCGPVWPICKLEWVMGGKEDGLDVLHYQPLEALHEDWSQRYGPIVIWNWNYGCGLETWGQQLGSGRCWKCQWGHPLASRHSPSEHDQECCLVLLPCVGWSWRGSSALMCCFVFQSVQRSHWGCLAVWCHSHLKWPDIFLLYWCFGFWLARTVMVLQWVTSSVHFVMYAEIASVLFICTLCLYGHCKWWVFESIPECSANAIHQRLGGPL